MTHKDLVALGLRWLKKRCTIAFSEFATSAPEIPDVIGWQFGNSILIECKTSRTDFLAEKKKNVRLFKFLGMGRKRYFLCPKNIIQVADLPDKWGLLWTTGKKIYVQCEAEALIEIDELSEIKFLVSMLRRTQVRLGRRRDLSEWLRVENMYEQKDLP